MDSFYHCFIYQYHGLVSFHACLPKKLLNSFMDFHEHDSNTCFSAIGSTSKIAT